MIVAEIERDIPVAREVEERFPSWLPVISVEWECPVCGRFGSTEFPERQRAATMEYLARISQLRPGVYAFTCSRHSLADVHALHHPVRIRQRVRRR